MSDEQSPTLDQHQSEERNFVLQQDSLLHTRIGFFVAAETIAGAVLSVAKPCENRELWVAALFGIVLTLLWWKSNANLSSRIRRATDTWKDPFFLNVWWDKKNENDKCKAQWLSSRRILVHYLPVLFLAGWIALIVRFCSASPPS